MDEPGKMNSDQNGMEHDRERHQDLQRERKSRGETRERHLEAGRALAGKLPKVDSANNRHTDELGARVRSQDSVDGTT